MDVKYRSIHLLALVVLLTVASGAHCPQTLWYQQRPPAPVVFRNEPTLADVVAVVNANRSLAMSLYANRVTISGGGVPAMNATMAIGSPRQVRLRAGTALTGQELDLGSNDQEFWIWIKRSQPPSLMVGRHDALAASPLGRTFPIRPEWLVEAIGLVYLDPQAPHIGPIRRPDGKLEIHTPVTNPAGQTTKVLVLDGRSGLIYEQHLLDERGQRMASAQNTRHFRDPLTGIILPRETTLTWTAMAMSLKVELNDVQVNPLQISADQWTKPQYPGYPEVDVATLPAFGAPPPGTTTAPLGLPPGPTAAAPSRRTANARYAPPAVQPLWPFK